MPGLALAFTFGICLVHRLATLPVLWWCLLAVPAFALLYPRPPWRWLGAGLIGFCWALLAASVELAERVPVPLDGETATVTGTIASLPEAGRRVLRFNLAVEKIRTAGGVLPGPDKLRLSWYDEFPRLRAGERWRLPVKLSTPHGYFNPGGFDYEGWLFREGIDGTGYVTSASNARRLAEGAWWHRANRWRGQIAGAMGRALPDGPPAALLIALAVADTRGITDPMWQALNATGTSHLIAISGMHIALVTGFGLVLGAGLARRFPLMLGWLPARHWGALLGLAAGFAYAALAGFVLPTRRALVMASVFLVALLLRRNLNPLQGIALALIGVLVLDPLAPLSPGFWLSFLAVAVLIAAFTGRARLGWLKSLIRAQWMVSLALLPLVAFCFQRISWIGPLANLVAIPLVEILAVPLVLAGMLLLPLPGPLAEWCLSLAHGLLAGFWHMIAWLAAQPATSTAMAAPSGTVLVLALLGCIWLLGPRGLPARGLGLVLLLPLGVTAPGGIPEGGFRVSVLDVGQGLATVVQTREHTLVYDTGPRYRSGFDTGSAVVVPYLRQMRIPSLSALVISHDDNDHAGGAASVTEVYPPGLWLVSGPDDSSSTQACRDGRRWHWDGVDFKVLHPPAGMPYLGNNSSCVIKVASRAGSVLLTGDIEAVVERRLIVTGDLAADLLVAPHHGSNSSSSSAFIEAVDPDWVVFSAGFNNRFGQPAAEVWKRYRAQNVRTLNTAFAGMVQWTFLPGREPGPRRYRQSEGHYWNPKPAALNVGAPARARLKSPAYAGSHE